MFYLIQNILAGGQVPLHPHSSFTSFISCFCSSFAKGKKGKKQKLIKGNPTNAEANVVVADGSTVAVTIGNRANAGTVVPATAT